MRFAFLLLSLVTLSKCNPPPPGPQSGQVAVRYFEDRKSFDVSAELYYPNGYDHAPKMTFLGSPLPMATPNQVLRFRGERRVPYPAEVSFNIVHPRLTLDYRASVPPPSIENLPDTIRTDENLSFSPLSVPLDSLDQLELFLEPGIGREPHRFLVGGPTQSRRITVPKNVLRGLPKGAYEAYLIQRRVRQLETEGVPVVFNLDYFTASAGVVVE